MGSRPRNSNRPKRSSRQQREKRADAVFKAAQVAEPARTAAVDTTQREHERIPPVGVVLREIRQQLDLICSCVIVVHHALTGQNVELDDDAALVLKRHVSDPLCKQVVRISHLLGEPADEGEEAS